MIERAADMLGLGTDAVRSRRAADEPAHEALEARSLPAGIRPAVVVGTAGTTATGSIDPLPAARRRRGSGTAVVPRRRRLRRRARALRRAAPAARRHRARRLDHARPAQVAVHAARQRLHPRPRPRSPFPTASTSTPPTSTRTRTLDRGVDLGFMGPAVQPRVRGAQGLGLAARARARRLRPPDRARRRADPATSPRASRSIRTSSSSRRGLSICCFRYRPPAWTTRSELDRLNERLMTALQLDGRVYPSNAILDGRFCLRACIVNFRTEAEDLDRVLEVARQRARQRGVLSPAAQLDLALIALDLFDAHVDRIAEPVRRRRRAARRAPVPSGFSSK